MCFVRADKTHAVQVGPETTVSDVKALIEARQGEASIAFSLLTWCPLLDASWVAEWDPAVETVPRVQLDSSEPCAAGLAVSAQRVVFGGRQLEDGALLAQCGVADEDTLHILARLLGGAKKRKKKTYTKPKKQKHKHKKIKLRVLKFFKARCYCWCYILELSFRLVW